jgi:hypothetical protein
VTKVHFRAGTRLRTQFVHHLTSGERDGGALVPGPLVVSSCDPAAIFQMREGALDLVERWDRLRVGLGLMTGVLPRATRNSRNTIVGGVSQHLGGLRQLLDKPGAERIPAVCPAVRSKAIRRPEAFATEWILVVRPPWLRPIACSCAPRSPGLRCDVPWRLSMLCGCARSWIHQGFQHLLPVTFSKAGGRHKQSGAPDSRTAQPSICRPCWLYRPPKGR